MSEIKKPEEKRVIQTVKKPDYYTRTGLKVFDFFIGFIGITFLLFGYVYLMSSGFLSSGLGFFYLLLLFIGILIVTCVISFKMGRKFIGIGALSVCLIPFLAFGSCLMLLR